MSRHAPPLVLALILLPFAGCALPPAETAEEAALRRGLSCREAGFTQGSEDYRLCILLQQTNERLASVERRLAFIEQDVRFPPFYPPRRYWW